jgi:hypothetical protein
VGMYALLGHDEVALREVVREASHDVGSTHLREPVACGAGVEARAQAAAALRRGLARAVVPAALAALQPAHTWS